MRRARARPAAPRPPPRPPCAAPARAARRASRPRRNRPAAAVAAGLDHLGQLGQHAQPLLDVRSPKHVCEPVWQTGPAGRTRISRASPSQSGVIDCTASVLPEVEPFSHSESREREWKWARPVRRVASSAGRRRPRPASAHRRCRRPARRRSPVLPGRAGSQPHRQPGGRRLALDVGHQVAAVVEDRCGQRRLRPGLAAPRTMWAGPPAPPDATTGTATASARPLDQLEVVAADRCRRSRCWSAAVRRRRARWPRPSTPARRGRCAGCRPPPAPASRR